MSKHESGDNRYQDNDNPTLPPPLPTPPVAAAAAKTDQLTDLLNTLTIDEPSGDTDINRSTTDVSIQNFETQTNATQTDVDGNNPEQVALESDIARLHTKILQKLHTFINSKHN
jgi:hypothetical protein